jgi:hypothetical protein
MHLEAKALKVTAILDPAAVAGIPTPNGVPKATLRITAGGRTYSADVNMKSLRRCIAAINEAGPDGQTSLTGFFFVRHDSYHRGGASPSFRKFLGRLNHR